MGDKVDIRKTVYNKSKVSSVLDRGFKTYLQPVEEDILTVEQFFLNYEELFYEIPAKGSINSHEYIIQRSSELVEIEDNQEDIQPLLDEITQLRTQILSFQQDIIELTQKNAELQNKINTTR